MVKGEVMLLTYDYDMGQRHSYKCRPSTTGTVVLPLLSVFAR